MDKIYCSYDVLNYDGDRIKKYMEDNPKEHKES